MDTQQKAAVIKDYQLADKDTGSTEVQVALLTARISQLAAHMEANKHDFHTKRALLRLVGQRRRLLTYIRLNEPERYKKLIGRLGLRR